jgi:hypothetical protein
VDPEGQWSESGINDVLLEDYETFEIRRASVPWEDLHQTIFLRLDLNME